MAHASERSIVRSIGGEVDAGGPKEVVRIVAADAAPYLIETANRLAVIRSSPLDEQRRGCHRGGKVLIDIAVKQVRLRNPTQIENGIDVEIIAIVHAQQPPVET